MYTDLKASRATTLFRIFQCYFIFIAALYKRKYEKKIFNCHLLVLFWLYFNFNNFISRCVNSYIDKNYSKRDIDKRLGKLWKQEVVLES